MGKKSLTQTEQIRTIIADELQRRPIIHLHIQAPAADATDPERLAATITRVLKDLQTPPESPDSHLARYFKTLYSISSWYFWYFDSKPFR